METWSAHLNNHPLRYDNFWFGDDTSNTLRDSLGLNSFPTYMIIESKSGKVIRAGFKIDKMEEVLATLE
jgi:protein-disulfide isomerase-like protein with CxxC motif